MKQMEKVAQNQDRVIKQQELYREVNNRQLANRRQLSKALEAKDQLAHERLSEQSEALTSVLGQQAQCAVLLRTRAHSEKSASSAAKHDSMWSAAASAEHLRSVKAREAASRRTGFQLSRGEAARSAQAVSAAKRHVTRTTSQQEIATA